MSETCTALADGKVHRTATGRATICGLTVAMVNPNMSRHFRRSRCSECWATPIVVPDAIRPVPEVELKPFDTGHRGLADRAPRSRKPSKPTKVKRTKPRAPVAPEPHPMTPVWDLCDRLDDIYAQAVRPRPLDPDDDPKLVRRSRRTHDQPTR